MTGNELLICICEKGFYLIDPPPKGKTAKQWARSNGELNDHVLRIEDMDGNVLWRRVLQ